MKERLSEELLSSHYVPSNNESGGAAVAFGIGGFFIGGLMGYLMRPSVPLMGQLDFGTVISRGANLKGIDQILVSVAESSFNYLLIGAITGCVIGVVIGRFLSNNSGKERTVNNSIMPKQITPEAQNNKVGQQPSITSTKDDIAGHIKLLTDLRNDGLITEEEFRQKRQALLARL